MPYVYFTGGKSAYVDKEKAQKLIIWKWGNEFTKKMPPDKNVEITGFGICELRDIKRIQEDEKTERDYSEGMADRQAEVEDWLVDVERYKKQTFKEKAERMIKTGCLLCFSSRGNKLPIDEKLKSELNNILVGWFDSNPNEWWADENVYGKLIKRVDRDIPISSSGFKSIGQILSRT